MQHDATCLLNPSVGGQYRPSHRVQLVSPDITQALGPSLPAFELVQTLAGSKVPQLQSAVPAAKK